MQEVAFLKNNADKWKQFEGLLSNRRKANPDILADLFIQLTDDLSYSKTFFPNSKTTRYLNALAAKVHQAIYRNKKEARSRFLTFWKLELPALMRESRRELLWALVIFVVAGLIGAVSAANDDAFVRLILGDSYVNMTLENIEKNEPLAVYKKMNQVDMFLGITFNNIRVSFYAFVAGVLLSIGTALLLFYNGVMLGAFQYFFYQQGLLLPSVLTIWIHGTLEISAIIVAGCAGFVIGNGILFPGTYTRTQSFMAGAKKGLKIVIGLVPIFITAGFLESFVTRHTEMPAALSVSIIAASLLFVVGYFIVYPAWINQKENGDGYLSKNRVSSGA
jgi:uncharacterized membrane protein SpoIIM required for sporulation